MPDDEGTIPKGPFPPKGPLEIWEGLVMRNIFEGICVVDDGTKYGI